MMEKRIASRRESIDWLYCLNWHLKDIIQASKDAGLSKDERKTLISNAAELGELKTKVLVKLIEEGNAKICKPHLIKKQKYYCVRLGRDHSFHVPMDRRILEASSQYEQKNPACKETSKPEGLETV